MINIKSLGIAGGTMVLAASAGVYMQMGSQPQDTMQMAAAPTLSTSVIDASFEDVTESDSADATADATTDMTVDLTAEVAEDTPVSFDMAGLPDEAETPAPMAEPTVEVAALSITATDMPPIAETTATMTDLPKASDMDTVPLLVAAKDDDIDNPASADLTEPMASDDCIVDLIGETRAAAMISLNLSAPCHSNARVSVQHGNLTFTIATDDAGLAQFEMPALSEKSLVIATMDDGNAAAVEVEVDTLSFYDRAVVQWQGDAGIELHAREFGADYDSDGHVWSGAPRDASVAARGIGGFVTTLGDPAVDNASLAEVYTFPTGTATAQGDIELTVEVAVTEGNCGRPVTAQVIEVSEGIVEKLSELDVTLPDCDAVGDFLLLKNLVEDLKIAAK
ncbi:translocase [Pseudooceanicola sp. MF1-13]|uniref:translocase n=1 Tax=Pseudooceanicola sp. MF1-13 TaxID=3379095 RepID=UPI003892339F